MQAEIFTSIFNQSISFISSEWKDEYGELLSDEHWSVIGRSVFSFVFKNEIDHDPLPIFDKEVIADYPRHYQYFGELKFLAGKTRNEGAQLIAKAIEEAPIGSLLSILGQRRTPATITDKQGVPPLKEQLMESCFEAYNEQICKAVRAREKHISRNEVGLFWGKIEGTPAEKELAAKAIVRKIIEEKTWWNVFTHYKHGVVYEIRLASGEGIRWRKDKLDLIGFLEPFV